ncbi:unnamed protein product [Closterium sp. NIES-65]|nr:unnamed protein product [Closterium sp. NIES-65]
MLDCLSSRISFPPPDLVPSNINILYCEDRKDKVRADGSVKVKFGKLFDETGDIFEALGGTLRAAKKRKMISFAAEMLLQGRDNNVDIILLPQ